MGSFTVTHGIYGTSTFRGGEVVLSLHDSDYTFLAGTRGSARVRICLAINFDYESLDSKPARDCQLISAKRFSVQDGSRQ